MYAVWMSLKENMNCSSKSTDVFQPEKLDGGNYVYHKVNPARDLHLVRKHPTDDVIFRQRFKRERFSELDKGDTSRNIVEMIFRAASIRPEKHTKKIERVLKVRNSPEIVQRFEDYREMVKKKALVRHTRRHPRSMVDGNELLMFYPTTMSCCCSSRKASKVLALCENQACGVCRIIQSGFETEGMKRNWIRMTAASDASDDEMVGGGVKGQSLKKAVVVCRVIAGRVVDMVGGGSEEGFDSLRCGGLSAKLVNLFVRNPGAVLPCFVIVCS